MIVSYKNDNIFNKKITKNFSLNELKCQCGKCAFSFIDSRFVDTMQILRNLYGKPITITCGYRCQEHNRELTGSVKHSYHQLGMAVDVVLPSDIDKFLEYLKALNLYYYINEEKGFTHIDGRFLL